MSRELIMFYTVITVAVVVFVIYACLALRQLTKVLQDVERTVERVNTIVEKVDGIVSGASTVASTVTALLSGISGYLSRLVLGGKSSSAISQKKARK